MTLNQVLLIGNAGRDAQLRTTQSGTQVANFSLAVNRSRQIDGEWQTETEWFNVSAWGRSAEYVAERVKKGSKVFVSGRLSSRSYIADNGETRFSMEVSAFKVMPLDRVSDATDSNGAASQGGSFRQDDPAPPAASFESGGANVEDLPW